MTSVVAARPVAGDVTVVLPTLGGPLLQGCLGSIADGTLWPARLVVVNQGESAPAAGWISALQDRGMDATHVISDRTGISAATNRGLACVGTAFAAVTHDDCRVRTDWLERLVACLRTTEDAIVTGRVEPDGPGIVLTAKTDPQRRIYMAPLLDGDVLFPPNMGFAVALLDRVGPFDEHASLATAGEDNEWAHRAMRAGVAIIYEPSVVVGHLARHRPDDLPALYRRYARGQGAFYGTWLRRRDWLIARRAARDLIRVPWLLLRGLVTRNGDLVVMGWGEAVGLLPGIVAGVQNTGVRVAQARRSY